MNKTDAMSLAEKDSLTVKTEKMSLAEKTIIENGLQQGYDETIDRSIAKLDAKIEEIKAKFELFEHLSVLQASYWEELYIDYTEEEINNADYILIDGYLYSNKIKTLKQNRGK